MSDVNTRLAAREVSIGVDIGASKDRSSFSTSPPKRETSPYFFHSRYILTSHYRVFQWPGSYLFFLPPRIINISADAHRRTQKNAVKRCATELVDMFLLRKSLHWPTFLMKWIFGDLNRTALPFKTLGRSGRSPSFVIQRGLMFLRLPSTALRTARTMLVLGRIFVSILFDAGTRRSIVRCSLDTTMPFLAEEACWPTLPPKRGTGSGRTGGTLGQRPLLRGALPVFFFHPPNSEQLCFFHDAPVFNIC